MVISMMYSCTIVKCISYTSALFFLFLLHLYLPLCKSLFTIIMVIIMVNKDDDDDDQMSHVGDYYYFFLM